jgi:class 3 adenylate cyclase
MSGLVTMVFTDLVSSTATKQAAPGRDLAERNAYYWERILQPHRQRVESSLEAAAGRVVSTQGDGYFLVFDDLIRAVHWSIDLQRSHLRQPIDTPLGALKVKIALHVGRPLLDGDNFIGHEVDYAARIAGLCQGGQILVSQSAATLVSDAGMSGTRLHPHGAFELKGVGHVPLFEILYDERAPLQPYYAPDPYEMLPPPIDGFVGRGPLLDSVREALDKGGVVVLHGEGGMGKTSLALEVAHREAETRPVIWIWGEQEPALEDCLRAMAQVFWNDDEHVPEASTLSRRILEQWNRTGALLVVDNFESIAADEALHAWLRAVRAPARALLTSREAPPGGGHVIPVRELSRPEAIELFCERMVRGGGRPPADKSMIDQLCAAVGDAPLPVELLAGRAARAPLSRLLERLRANLDVLANTADASRPARHRSIRACFALSVENLSAPARELLGRMAVWPDGVGLEVLHTSMTTTATQLADWDEAAEELVARSLWRLDEERWEVHPLVRQYALEALGPERDAIVRQSLEAFVRVAEAKSAHLRESDHPTPAVEAALTWFDDEWSNLLEAVERASAMEAWPMLLALARAVEHYWPERGLWWDAHELYERALVACERLGNTDATADMRALHARAEEFVRVRQ